MSNRTCTATIPPSLLNAGLCGKGKLVGNSVGNVLASEALAAIDKVWSYGEAKEVK